MIIITMLPPRLIHPVKGMTGQWGDWCYFCGRHISAQNPWCGWDMVVDMGFCYRCTTGEYSYLPLYSEGRRI